MDRRSSPAWARHRDRPAPASSVVPSCDPLPDRDGPSPPADALADANAEPARLVAPTVANPFAPGREVGLARVSGARLERLGVRDGDHVALLRRDAAEDGLGAGHGDLAAVVGDDGRAALWKVYPEGETLRLSTGDPAWSRRTGPRPRVQGVVVAILRKFAE